MEFDLADDELQLFKLFERIFCDVCIIFCGYSWMAISYHSTGKAFLLLLLDSPAFLVSKNVYFYVSTMYNKCATAQ